MAPQNGMTVAKMETQKGFRVRVEFKMDIILGFKKLFSKKHFTFSKYSAYRRIKLQYLQRSKIAILTDK